MHHFSTGWGGKFLLGRFLRREGTVKFNGIIFWTRTGQDGKNGTTFACPKRGLCSLLSKYVSVVLITVAAVVVVRH